MLPVMSVEVEEQGVGASKHRYRLIPRVLVFIFRGRGHEREVLLLKGAPDKKIWPNLYNGIGGHVERGESLHTAARREVAEESGLAVAELQFCGSINIDAGDERVGIGMFVFRADYTAGTPIDSDEGLLEWVALAALGDYPLVGDLPVLLARIGAQPPQLPFFGRYWYEDGALQIELDGQRVA